MNQSEIELIQRIKQVDASAFKTLFTTYYAPLCAYAQRYVVQIEAAEEIVQDLFMRQWDNRQHFELHTSFRSYMYRAVRNNCIDYLKHIQIQRKYEKTMVVTLQDTVSEKIDKLEELELQQRIDDAVSRVIGQGIPA